MTPFFFQEQNRRQFIKQLSYTTAGLYSCISNQGFSEIVSNKQYSGPNIILIRFGGGVRRQETIEKSTSLAPYFYHALLKEGTLFSNVFISDGLKENLSIDTSHGQGTLYLLTGNYDEYKDINGKIFGDRYSPKYPTLFEYLRKQYSVKEHESLIINGEDRVDEEFFTFSSHHKYGVDYRCQTLSLFQYKMWLLENQLKDGSQGEEKQKHLKKKLQDLKDRNYLSLNKNSKQPKIINQFWQQWFDQYGALGFKNARGDRLLTKLALDSLEKLKPKLMLINYQDPDYVHWGNANHYKHGIRIIDEGLEQLFTKVNNLETYKNNTIFVIVPDHGRDNALFSKVPYQHHFNTKSARESFCLFLGPGIPKNRIINKKVDQIQITSTIGQLMNMRTSLCQGPVLEELFDPITPKIFSTK